MDDISSKFLQNMIVNHEENGISITLNAEPMILKIEINPSEMDALDLAEKIKACINSAIQKTAMSVIQEATDQLGDK
ncbi:hypothetical protein A2899_00505 [Candidatus Amesbacteria bacterium RIFCSPLOWO2_01_FULL_49_25]|uniref:Uncharacterized protein n=1 Tax=Candidatus Amesbacteria bacterium RIFCSPHIGHO2_01_FULL_48_32b TaxID=1797253 RepID=A0A1F4YDP9_9BACT|nr:MAG: hypothetical protein A2876_03950 [Candidatus Amesbacteria bacterium RIFCSPHIGHO2_01_FULL_48_32b]OGD07604.1 MAG: hypothetical protein A2899_00505 [Candidatus Amesbacteria bacterium RIFCSPLOWO2_01_FULL_49_25]